VTTHTPRPPATGEAGVFLSPMTCNSCSPATSTAVAMGRTMAKVRHHGELGGSSRHYVAYSQLPMVREPTWAATGRPDSVHPLGSQLSCCNLHHGHRRRQDHER
jgi:hypothetical protein